MRRLSRLRCGAGMEDPRIVRTRAAVLDAATDLLVEGGPTAVTIDAIVVRSGVAKSTIYRHWASRDDVLVSVFEHCAPDVVEPDPGLPFEAALRVLVRSLVDAFTAPHWARIVPALLALKYHEDGIADVEKKLEHRQKDVVGSVLRRGIEDGAIRGGLDVDEATAHLVGPVLFAHLTGVVPMTHGFADRTVDGFLKAYRPD